MKKLFTLLIFFVMISSVFAVSIENNPTGSGTQETQGKYYEKTYLEKILSIFKSPFIFFQTNDIPKDNLECSNKVWNSKIFQAQKENVNIGLVCSEDSIIDFYSCNDENCQSKSFVGTGFKIDGLKPTAKELIVGNYYLYECYNCYEYSSQGEIGDSCETYLDCGGACNDMRCDEFICLIPRCINGGNGKICVCGEDDGIITTTCADVGCPSGEKCVNGVCTVTTTQRESGNPGTLTEEDVKQIIEDNPLIKIKSCDDGTDVFMCSDDIPYYCDKDQGLIKKPELCGCPEGKKLDYQKEIGGQTIFYCCNNDGSDCLSGGVCINGIEIKKDCYDGGKVLVKKCENNEWVDYPGVCGDNNGNSFNLPIWLFIGGGIVVILIIMMLLGFGGYFLLKRK